MTPNERLVFLDRLQGELRLPIQADLLSLNWSSLYYRPVLPSADELVIKPRIDEIRTERPSYGVRRVAARLRPDGLLINHKAIERHMRETGQASIAPWPSLGQAARRHTVYPWLLRLRAIVKSGRASSGDLRRSEEWSYPASNNW